MNRSILVNISAGIDAGMREARRKRILAINEEIKELAAEREILLATYGHTELDLAAEKVLAEIERPAQHATPGAGVTVGPSLSDVCGHEGDQFDPR